MSIILTSLNKKFKHLNPTEIIAMNEILWPAPPAQTPLAADEVHIWCIDLDQPGRVIPQFQQILAPDEQACAARFVFAQHRDRFIVARARLRMILGHYFMSAPTALQFAYGPYGKPVLAAPAQQALCFNLSHSETLALCAVTYHRQLGVDIEAIRRLADMLALARTVFTPNEYATFCAVPTPRQTAAFFNGWTRKEAFIKALGEGLSHPLDQFEVSLARTALVNCSRLPDKPRQPPTGLWRRLPRRRGMWAQWLFKRRI